MSSAAKNRYYLLYFDDRREYHVIQGTDIDPVDCRLVDVEEGSIVRANPTKMNIDPEEATVIKIGEQSACRMARITEMQKARNGHNGAPKRSSVKETSAKKSTSDQLKEYEEMNRKLKERLAQTEKELKRSKAEHEELQKSYDFVLAELDASEERVKEKEAEIAEMSNAGQKSAVLSVLKRIEDKIERTIANDTTNSGRIRKKAKERRRDETSDEDEREDISETKCHEIDENVITVDSKYVLLPPNNLVKVKRKAYFAFGDNKPELIVQKLLVGVFTFDEIMGATMTGRSNRRRVSNSHATHALDHDKLCEIWGKCWPVFSVKRALPLCIVPIGCIGR